MGEESVAVPALRRLKRWAMAWLPNRLVPPLAARVALLADEVELHLLDLLCDSSRVSVDVGANIGIYSYLLSRRSRHVFAAEPHPALAALLRRGLPVRTTVLEMALSDTAGVSELHVPLQGGADLDTRSSLEVQGNLGWGSRSISVQTRTLDGLGFRDVGFLKIDVEGHGLAVLRGGQGLLRCDRPCVLIEVEDRPGPGSMSNVVELMNGLDYDGYIVVGLEVVSIGPCPAAGDSAPADRERVRDRPLGDVRNAIFLPRRESVALLQRLRKRVRTFGQIRRLLSLLTA